MWVRRVEGADIKANEGLAWYWSIRASMANGDRIGRIPRSPAYCDRSGGSERPRSPARNVLVPADESSSSLALIPVPFYDSLAAMFLLYADSAKNRMLSSSRNSSVQAKPIKTALVQNGRKVITSNYPDGNECIEELDLKTDDILGALFDAPVRIHVSHTRPSQ